MKLSQMADGNAEEKKKSVYKSYDTYKDMTQEQLMAQLTNEINKQKRKGNFDYESLKSSIDRISIYLPKETYKNIMNILENYK